MSQSKIKTLINNFLSKLNLKIVKLNSVEPNDLTKIKLNAIGAQYLAGHRPMVINIELKDGRTNNWFDMTENSFDPGIFSIKTALKKGFKDEDLYNDILKSLQEYYSLMKFKNASHSLNIESFDDENIKNYPWWAFVLPWDSFTFEDQIKNYPYDVKRNRLMNGLDIPSDDPNTILKENYEKGWPSHAKQYTDLVSSIKKQGFKSGAKYGYVSAEILIDKNKICWKPGAEGNHRATVAAALGIKTIPVLVTKIIRFEELEYWPNVRKGYFTKEQAKKIFYNIFNARTSKIHESWVRKIL